MCSLSCFQHTTQSHLYPHAATMGTSVCGTRLALCLCVCVGRASENDGEAERTGIPATWVLRMVWNPEILRHKTAVMHRIQLLAARGYRHYVAGECRNSRITALEEKFCDRYLVGATKIQRWRAKRAGRYCSGKCDVIERSHCV